MLKLFFLISYAMVSLTVWSATSEENRSGKKLELSLQHGHDYRLNTPQLAAMYFIQTNHLIGLKIGANSSNGERQTNVAAQYKHYLSNSFYVAGEVFYLNTREDINGFWGDVFTMHDYAEYRSLGAGVRIGNQWAWKNFTIGCDWIGVGHRFVTFKKETPDLQNTTITILNAIVGFSF